MHRAKGKGYLNVTPHVPNPTFLQQHLPLPRRFDPTENWLSSRCLTSVNATGTGISILTATEASTYFNVSARAKADIYIPATHLKKKPS